MYAPMPQCERIILGGSSDQSLTRILSKLAIANVIPGKVVLLQSSSFNPEIDKFQSDLFPRVSFGELFIDQKVSPAKNYNQITADAISPLTRKMVSPSPPMSPMSPGFAFPPKLAEPELGTFRFGHD
jgi:hypothetical protein